MFLLRHEGDGADLVGNTALWFFSVYKIRPEGEDEDLGWFFYEKELRKFKKNLPRHAASKRRR